MKSLRHSGILIPPRYKKKGYNIFIKGKSYNLSDKTEEMAFAWCRKLGTDYVKDKKFRRNFFEDFTSKLGVPYTEDINFGQLISCLDKERQNKELMTKEDKKKEREKRKKLREKRKAKYGIAIVDGKEVEIQNWIAEPSGIFMGRSFKKKSIVIGHPKRGRWKEGPRKKDIILNLSPDAPQLQGWKKIEWKPNKLYVAKWFDSFSKKWKYVWLSDTWSKKQEKEKAKFKKAEKLRKNLDKVEHLIGTGLYSSDLERRKVSTVCYLIFNLNMRVGDEKEPDEASTVGAITLRSEHFKIRDRKVYLDFLGKDSVRWKRVLLADPQFIRNIKNLEAHEKSYLFEGINSKKVTKFLNEALPGLTAKVFRTFRGTEAFREKIKSSKVTKESKIWEKKNALVLANLASAIILNHKKALSKNFQEQMKRKRERLNKLIERKRKAKKREALRERIRKLEKDIELKERISEYNLNTSKNSYINPVYVVKYCERIDFPIEKFYSKAQIRKHSWAIEKKK